MTATPDMVADWQTEVPNDIPCAGHPFNTPPTPTQSGAHLTINVGQCTTGKKPKKAQPPEVQLEKTPSKVQSS